MTIVPTGDSAGTAPDLPVPAANGPAPVARPAVPLPVAVGVVPVPVAVVGALRVLEVR